MSPTMLELCCFLAKHYIRSLLQGGHDRHCHATVLSLKLVLCVNWIQYIRTGYNQCNSNAQDIHMSSQLSFVPGWLLNWVWIWHQPRAQQGICTVRDRPHLATILSFSFHFSNDRSSFYYFTYFQSYGKKESRVKLYKALFNIVWEAVTIAINDRSKKLPQTQHTAQYLQGRLFR